MINKCDRLPDGERTARLEAIERRIREVNPEVYVVRVDHGALDPCLVYDAADREPRSDELPFDQFEADEGHDHTHAAAVTVTSTGPVDPQGVVELLEHPPEDAYRIKGTVAVAGRGTTRSYAINLVGRAIHIARRTGEDSGTHLVAIGMHLDEAAARARLEQALRTASSPQWEGLRKLERYRRLSD